MFTDRGSYLQIPVLSSRYLEAGIYKHLYSTKQVFIRAVNFIAG